MSLTYQNNILCLKNPFPLLFHPTTPLVRHITNNLLVDADMCICPRRLSKLTLSCERGSNLFCQTVSFEEEHILEAARKRKNVWIVRPDSPSEESKEKYSCIFLKPNKGYSVYYPQ